ncbi:MAG: hypothetical protein ACLR70_03840 [Streptococcus thermophilus]
MTINGGNIDVYATDDGINAGNSNASQSEIFFKMTGGTLNVEVGEEIQIQSIPTAILLYRGNDYLTGQSGFDFDGSATYTGGDITINGENKLRLKTQCLVGVALKVMVVPKVVGNQVALAEVTKES